ncbi:hypothetical protein [Robertmurraya kyonggiensis]|uniref:hypothetical protein n=1 Tax=Robertmurraya kyonggiensis TaxID=1037680 RepID=UPI00130DE3B4|nr:hypothetical protein [Robertmurraya kyonggiensis]
MNATTVLKRVELQREDAEKAQLLRGLDALLQTTPVNRKTTRKYLQNAINYIEKN